MPQNIELEIKVIKKFVDKSRQDRYIQFVSSAKNRIKFIRDLPHFNSFKWDLFYPVHENKEQVILEALQRNSVAEKNCYVISENSSLDTKIIDTKEAIGKTIGYGMGTILVFGDAEMIFFESEEAGRRFISQKVK